MQKKVFKPAIRNKAATRFFYDLAGNDIEMLSRMARAITNHAPTGEYRRRFYPDRENRCPSCPQRVQTRTHVLFHCPKYTPLYSSMTNWSHDKQNHKSWKSFFLRNPSAFIEPVEFLEPRVLCAPSSLSSYALTYHIITSLASLSHTKQLDC